MGNLLKSINSLRELILMVKCMYKVSGHKLRPEAQERSSEKAMV